MCDTTSYFKSYHRPSPTGHVIQSAFKNRLFSLFLI
ncbi:hypothetical protein HDEF_0501 [Candidatus Hamiltonella defensa 5AT (Acyrthosiphon pisum)]|uniref:Uncharacterized protein n=1 Tax=Hamiltonella defensa subsp. Acyrthosiphon pisum (strain 5AT) TaxID=572265 RepID=C4K3W2_HAMD5|nr:hypothetical protein HDEF_0501 [Candidatus Hamiltonella defensa 5AT (Acyrthosiphon pisum)]